MNETENIENVTETLQDISGNDGVSLDSDNSSGVLFPDVSAGDVGEVEQSTDSGHATGTGIPESNTDTVSGSDYSVSDTGISVVYTENLEKIETEIKGINALLLLVFVFLLLEWTEKKFSVIVKRFGERRRR